MGLGEGKVTLLPHIKSTHMLSTWLVTTDVILGHLVEVGFVRCGRQLTPRYVPVLYPGACDYLRLHNKGELRLPNGNKFSKEMEWRKQLRMIWCEKNWTGLCWLWRQRKGVMSQEIQATSGSQKRQGIGFSSRASTEECSPAPMPDHTLLLAQCYTSNPQTVR